MIKLSKFQIEKYRSIQSFSPCWLANDITILAGKNESGKTAVLEALYNFGQEGSIPEETKPNDDDALKSEIHLWFSVSGEDKAHIFGNTSILKDSECKKYIEKHGLPITKRSDGSYEISEEFIELLDNKDQKTTQEIENEIRSKINKILKNNPQLKDLLSIDETRNYEELKSNIIEIKNSFSSNNSDDGADKSNGLPKYVLELTESLDRDLEVLLTDPDHKTVLDNILKALPPFVFFDISEHELPYEINLSEVENYPAVMDFIKVADIDIEKVRNTTNENARANYLNNKTAEISGNFHNYWNQEKIYLRARVSGDKFIIWIEEENNRVNEHKPENRSQGLRWFLSFYLRLAAHNITENEGSVILIDEPGLYLHAQAQKDILSVLEDLTEEGMQIVFSTHSPYLFDTAKMNRIRLVERTPELGSVISNKIYNSADRDALTPVITAMGLNIAQDSGLIRKETVLLEGPADYYFIQAMVNYLKNDTDISYAGLMPCKGATQMHLLASIMIGWGLEFVCVLDNDTAGKSAKSDLKKLDIDDEKIIFVLGNSNSEIEDLFSKDDFQNFVLPEDLQNKSETRSNSEIVKRNTDKVVLAKNFMEAINDTSNNYELSEETKNNFVRLFTEIHAQLRGKEESHEVKSKTEAA